MATLPQVTPINPEKVSWLAIFAEGWPNSSAPNVILPVVTSVTSSAVGARRTCVAYLLSNNRSFQTGEYRLGLAARSACNGKAAKLMKYPSGVLWNMNTGHVPCLINQLSPVIPRNPNTILPTNTTVITLRRDPGIPANHHLPILMKVNELKGPQTVQARAHSSVPALTTSAHLVHASTVPANNRPIAPAQAVLQISLQETKVVLGLQPLRIQAGMVEDTTFDHVRYALTGSRKETPLETLKLLHSDASLTHAQNRKSASNMGWNAITARMRFAFII